MGLASNGSRHVFRRPCPRSLRGHALRYRLIRRCDSYSAHCASQNRQSGIARSLRFRSRSRPYKARDQLPHAYTGKARRGHYSPVPSFPVSLPILGPVLPACFLLLDPHSVGRFRISSGRPSNASHWIWNPGGHSAINQKTQ